MSYDPSINQNASEFIAAWKSSNQTLPSRTSGTTEASTNTLIELNRLLNTTTEVDLSSNVISTNTAPALWYGDIRSTSGGNVGNQFTIEFETNDLQRHAAYQDERAAYRDDVCYAVSNEAELKIKITYRIAGNTIAPYVRVIGILIGQ